MQKATGLAWRESARLRTVGSIMSDSDSLSSRAVLQGLHNYEYIFKRYLAEWSYRGSTTISIYS